MRTYVNTFSNVTTKVLTYSHLQSLTQGFGLGPYFPPYTEASRHVHASSILTKKLEDDLLGHPL